MCMRGLEILFSDQKVSFQNSKPIMGVHRHVCLDLFVYAISHLKALVMQFVGKARGKNSNVK